jgi:uncharacterized protein (TIGR02266 family)
MPDDKGRRATGAIPIASEQPVRRPTGAIALPGGQPVRRTTGAIPIAGEQPVRRPTGSFFVPEAGPQTRDLRVAVSAPVKIRYESILDFHETQSVNISRSGMFLSCADPRPVGTVIDFELALADGLSLLRGKGEVVRVTGTPVAGMGVRFRELDEEARRFLDRIVQVNEEEGRSPAVSLDFASLPAGTPTPIPTGSGRFSTLRGATTLQPGLLVSGRDLHVKLTPATVGYFTNNPLLNIRLGGFVVPCEENVPLGAVFEVVIESFEGHSLFTGKGKVVAKQEHRLGVRLSDVDKTVLARLQAEVARLSPFGR